MAWTVDLSGKVALVTGGATGIGYAIGSAFLEAGAAGVATARSDASLAACNPETEYGTMQLLKLDVTNDISIDAALEQIGRLDILVNNAGMVKRALEFQSENFADVINTNLLGVQRMAQHCLPKLALTRGCIINVASMWSYFGSRTAPGYTASKTGLVGLTRSLAHAWAEHGIRVNAICPGYVLTPLVEKQIPDTAKARGLSEEQVKRDVLLGAQPTKQFVTTEQLGALAVFLCSDEAASITGTALPVDGGWTAQ